MKKLLMGTVAAIAAVAATAPAQAVVLVSGAPGVLPTAFSTIAATQGTRLAFNSFSDTAFTFAATFRSAVYRNTLGTLDFYFQVQRDGAGTIADQMIKRLTLSNYGGYVTDAYAAAPDPDGGNFFTAAANPGAPGTSTTTVNKSANGQVVEFAFGQNGLENAEISATYVVRTNATQFNNIGTFGIIDGSTIDGLTFQPTGAPVPEPATWGMMLLGFGLVGAAMRGRRRAVVTA